MHNVLPIETVDLTVSLRATAQIIPMNGSQMQNYGILSSSRGTVLRQFQFQASTGHAGPLAASGCGGTVQAIFDLQDNGQSLGSITIPFRLGRLTQPLLQDFESVSVPRLPQGWSGGNPAGGPPSWVTTSNAPPNVLVPGEPDQVNDVPPRVTGPVSISAFAPDPPSASDSSLSSPVIPITTDRAVLRFRHSFDLESSFDGAVLEIGIGTLPFADILQMGGTFAQDGYNATLVAGSSALGGRPAWSGNSGDWLITEVNLPPNAAQQSVQLRWRLATDGSRGGNGWFIDDAAISEYPRAPLVPNPVMLRPGRFRNIFGFYIDTVGTRTYSVEFKNSLSDSAWELLRTFTGDGTEQFINDPTLGPAQRFYRFRVE